VKVFHGWSNWRADFQLSCWRLRLGLDSATGRHCALLICTYLLTYLELGFHNAVFDWAVAPVGHRVHSQWADILLQMVLICFVCSLCCVICMWRWLLVYVTALSMDYCALYWTSSMLRPLVLTLRYLVVVIVVVVVVVVLFHCLWIIVFCSRPFPCLVSCCCCSCGSFCSN